MKEKITTIKVWDKKYRLIPFLVLLFLFLALVIFILGACYRLNNEANKKGPCNKLRIEKDILDGKFAVQAEELKQQQHLYNELRQEKKEILQKHYNEMQKVQENIKNQEILKDNMIKKEQENNSLLEKLKNNIINIKDGIIENYQFLLNLFANNNNFQINNMNDNIKTLLNKFIDKFNVSDSKNIDSEINDLKNNIILEINNDYNTSKLDHLIIEYIEVQRVLKQLIKEYERVKKINVDDVDKNLYQNYLNNLEQGIENLKQQLLKIVLSMTEEQQKLYIINNNKNENVIENENEIRKKQEQEVREKLNKFKNNIQPSNILVSGFKSLAASQPVQWINATLLEGMAKSNIPFVSDLGCHVISCMNQEIKCLESQKQKQQGQEIQQVREIEQGQQKQQVREIEQGQQKQQVREI